MPSIAVPNVHCDKEGGDTKFPPFYLFADKDTEPKLHNGRWDRFVTGLGTFGSHTEIKNAGISYKHLEGLGNTDSTSNTCLLTVVDNGVVK